MHDDHIPHDAPAETLDACPEAEPMPGAVRRERELRATTDEAWALLRDAEGLGRWLADDVDVLIAPGESGTLRDADGERSVTVESVDEGRRVALRWWTGDDDVALVDLTVEPVHGDPARSRIVVTEVPLRVVAAPDVVPASWTTPATGGPQMAARQLVGTGS